MYLDGNPVGSPIVCGHNADVSNFSAFVGDLFIVHNQNPAAGRNVAVDELKLWNYAKSDFSDSLNPQTVRVAAWTVPSAALYVGLSRGCALSVAADLRTTA